MEYPKLDDLKRIKKEYGENMAHLCRSLFPTILETPGLLYHILSSHFAKSKSLYGDITSEHKEYLFKEYIYHFCDLEIIENETPTKSVKELLDEAGYELFECKKYEDILKFKKYYKKDEELCTFRDPYRIESHHIFFIVKKDIDKIKREDFIHPYREDEYSTSILDLQFDIGQFQRLSIKSRYNHTVNNPDATYSNNLENIAPGLTAAFEHDYEFNIGSEARLGFELKDYVQARDGKFYKYNYEINNIHYCPNNIIIDNGSVIDAYSDRSRYTFMDYFILDEQEKKIIVYDKTIHDSFVDGLQNITNIEITKNGDYKEVKLTMEGNKEAIIKLDSRGRIIGYINNNIEKVRNDFLSKNKVLTELQMDSLKVCGNSFLARNEALEILSLENLETCGYFFLNNNKVLNKLNLPNLISCGGDFLVSNIALIKVSFPKLKKCETNFLYNAPIVSLECPNLEECGFSWLRNSKIEVLSLPKLVICGIDFVSCNDRLKIINLPNLQDYGKVRFLNTMIQAILHKDEIQLEEVNIPHLKGTEEYNYLMIPVIKKKYADSDEKRMVDVK